MKYIFNICLFLVIFYQNGIAQCKIDYSNYNIQFEDNFDTYNDVSELTNKWQLTPPYTPYFGWGDLIDNMTHDTMFGEYYLPSQVSLVTGGYVRFTANKLLNPPTLGPLFANPGAPPYYRRPTWVSGMLQIPLGVHYDPPSQVDDTTGFTHGMFEIRCKLPKEQSFPAFWLHSTKEKSEIDIFEYNGGINTKYFWSTQYQRVDEINYPYACGHFYKKESWDDLADDFHTWTCVWTPTTVTTFFDGREIKTITNNFMPTETANAYLILDLAMYKQCPDETHMDIDYVKVFKPKNNDYSLPYKSSIEYMHHDIFQNINVDYQVSDVHGSIAVNKNNSNQLFYRGTDDRIYEANVANGNWTSSIIPYNYQAPFPATLVKGDLVYNSYYNYIIYKGQDNRIQFFNKYNNAWWQWYIDDHWETTSYQISPDPGSLEAINDNGVIVYKGMDNKIHFFTYDEGVSDWVHQWLPYTYGSQSSSDYVKGDVIVDQTNHWIYYKGQDDRLQCFIPSHGSYSHIWVDAPNNPTANKVSSTPGSIIIANNSNEIYYKGFDNKLHKYSQSGFSFTHSLVNYQYSDADYIRGNLAYNPSYNKVYYIGFDGRIQFFQKYMDGSYVHWWTDDYWNTSSYTSYDNLALAAKVGSLCIQLLDNKVVYSQKDGDLAYFIWEQCEVLNPSCDTNASQSSILNTKKKINYLPLDEGQLLNQKTDVAIYPNPFLNNINIDFNSILIRNTFIAIYDVTGKLISKIKTKDQVNTINIQSLQNGVYFIVIDDGENITRRTIIK